MDIGGHNIQVVANVDWATSLDTGVSYAYNIQGLNPSFFTRMACKSFLQLTQPCVNMIFNIEQQNKKIIHQYILKTSKIVVGCTLHD